MTVKNVELEKIIANQKLHEDLSRQDGGPGSGPKGGGVSKEAEGQAKAHEAYRSTMKQMAEENGEDGISSNDERQAHEAAVIASIRQMAGGNASEDQMKILETNAKDHADRARRKWEGGR